MRKRIARILIFTLLWQIIGSNMVMAEENIISAETNIISSVNARSYSASENSLSENGLDKLIGEFYSGSSSQPVHIGDKYYMAAKQKWAAGTGVQSSNKKLLKVNKKGIVTAKKVGNADLIVNGNSYNIEIIKPIISDKKVQLTLGEAKSISLNGLPEGNFKVSYKSLNGSVAQVNKDGKITATGIGSTKIIAQAFGQKYQCKVKVTPASGNSEYALYITLGKGSAVKGVKKPTYQVSGDNIQVKGKKLIGKKAGETLAVYQNGAVKVFVNNPQITKTLQMKKGERLLIVPDDTYYFGGWMSNKSYIASVSEYGVIKAESAGKANITAKIGNKKYKIKVIVNGEGKVKDPEKWYRLPVTVSLNNIPGSIVNIADNGDFYYDEDNTIEENYHTVKFISEDKEYIVINNVKDGETIKEPETDPISTDNQLYFNGWYENENKFDFSTPITEDKVLVAKFTSDIIHKVYFNLRGLGISFRQLVKHGDLLIDPEINIEGHEFKGWYLDGSLYDFSKPVVKDFSLFSLWDDEEPNFYTVSFDSAGGTHVDTQYILDGQKAIEPQNVTKESFEFKQWELNGNKYDFDTPVTNNINLIANWIDRRGITYTVSFNSNGGSSINEQVVAKGEKAAKPADPSRNGYRFLGWKLGDTYFNFNTEIHNDICLIAEWSEPIEYSITYNLNGGNANNRTKYTVETESFTLNNPSKNRYDFKGWTVDNGTTPQMQVTINKGSYGDKVFTANYDAKTYSIEDKVSGNGVELNPEEIIPGGITGDKNYFELLDPHRTGYDFLGWNQIDGPEVDLTVRNQANTGIKISIQGLTDDEIDALKFEAKWQLKKFRITFNPNGGTTNLEYKIVEYGSNYDELPSANWPGHTLNGWYTSATGGQKIEPSTKVEILEDQELFANWDRAQYTLTFDANGGSCTTSTKLVTYEDTYGELPEATKNKYEFNGWWTDRDRGSNVSSNDVVRIIEDTILYAHYVGPAKFNTASALATKIDDNTKYFKQYTGNIEDVEDKLIQDNLVSVNDEEYPESIFIWYDTESFTAYWYAPSANKVYLNENSNGLFSGKSNLVSADLTNIDCSKTIDTSEMFSGCTSINDINLNGTNMKIVNASGMFSGCTSLMELDLSDVDFTAAENIAGLLYGCTNLEVIFASDKTEFGDMNPVQGAVFMNDTKLVGGKGTRQADTTDVWNAGVGSWGFIDDDDHDGYLTDVRYKEEAVVTFDPDNGDPAFTQTIKRKTKVTKPAVDPVSTLDGVEFNGWMLDGEPYDFNAIVRRNITLKASWKGISMLIAGGYSNNIGNKMNINAVSFNRYTGNKLDITDKLIDDNLISINTDEYPDSTWMWYDADSKTEYWYSDANIVYLNENCNKLFYNSNTWSEDYNLQHLDLSDFDTSKVTDMSNMFSNCRKLTELNISNFNTSKVTDMSNMFSNCRKLTELNISNFNTSKVAYMQQMFNGCSELTAVDISSFDTSKVTDMSHMFAGCQSLESLDLSGFDTSKVTNMGYMFISCKKLENLDLTGFDTREVTDMSTMFKYCTSLQSLDVSMFNTSKVTNMYEMFNHCWSLESIDISSFDTSNVINMVKLFSMNGNYNDSGVELGGKLKNVTLGTMELKEDTSLDYLFEDCQQLESIDISGIDFTKVDSTNFMFEGCKSLKDIDTSHMIFDDSLTSINNMFDGCSSLESVDLSGFNTENVSNLSSLFSGCSSLEYLDLSMFNTTKVSYMTNILSGCSNLKEIDLTSFSFVNPYEDGHLIINVSGMFSECSNLEKIYANSDIREELLDASGYSSRDPFDECSDKLIGGNGTVWNSSNTDKQYMHIDGIGGEPGYFTKKSTITLHSNNTSDKTISVNYIQGITHLTLSQNGFIPDEERLYFTGYTENPDGTGEFYAAGTEYQPDMPEDLYACWEYAAMFTTWDVDAWYGTDYIKSFEHYTGDVSLIQDKLVDENKEHGSKVALENYDYPEPIYVWAGESDAYGCFPVYWWSPTRKVFAAEDASYAFYDVQGGDTSYTSMEKYSIEGIDTSKVTNMSHMFANSAQGFVEKMFDGIEKLDTSSVTDMSYMFAYAVVSEHEDTDYSYVLDLSNFDTSNVTDMSYMFYETDFIVGSGYNKDEYFAVDVSSFDTSKVTNMAGMFASPIYDYGRGARQLTVPLDVSSFNTSNVTNMSDMFHGVIQVGNLDLSNFDTHNVTNMSDMFWDLQLLTDLETWTVDRSILLDVSNFDTSNVINMEGMFYSCYVTAINVDSWDTSKVNNMLNIFDCPYLEVVYSNNDFDISSLPDSDKDDPSYIQLYDLIGEMGTRHFDSSWSVDDMGACIYRVDGGAESPGVFTKIANYDYYDISWDSPLTEQSFLDRTANDHLDGEVYAYKRGSRNIFYQADNGRWTIADTSKAGHIKVKKGSKIYIQMISGQESSTLKVQNLPEQTRSYSGDKLMRIPYEPTSNMKITKVLDEKVDNAYNWTLNMQNID